MCAIHGVGPKYVFRLGMMFSKLARPHEVRVMSLEPQNIPGDPFNTYFRNCRVYPVSICAIQRFWAELSISFGQKGLETGAST